MKTTPFWWDEAPPGDGCTDAPAERPGALIVGAGYTGLSAAITLAEAGVSNVTVIDCQRIGEGASSRNGGQIGNAPKFTLAQATRRHGAQRAGEIFEDYALSMPFLLERAATLQADIDLQLCGSVLGAHTRRDLEGLRQWRAGLPAGQQSKIEIFSKAEMAPVLRSDIYHGAMLQHDAGSVHPAKYVAALAARASSLGVAIHTGWRYLGKEKDGMVRVARSGGGEALRLRPDMVLLAVNGYAGPELPFLRKRVVPIQSYMIATEPLPFDAMEALIPQNRVAADTKHVLYYYRRSPDGRRMLFGGRASFRKTGEEKSALGLRRFMASTFPSLAEAKITHSWLGNVAFSLDFATHLGRSPAGEFYSSCYNGNGVSMATYMGHRIAEAMLGRPGHTRGLMDTRFPQLPFYNGDPWFLPVVGSWYRFLDMTARIRG